MGIIVGNSDYKIVGQTLMDTLVGSNFDGSYENIDHFPSL